MKTAKERYDREMANIRQSKPEPDPPDDEPEDDDEDSEEDEEEMLQDVAENANETARANGNSERAALAGLNRLNVARRTSHLHPRDAVRLSGLLAAYEHAPIDDPVLQHLVAQKLKLTESYLKAETEAKQLYQDLMRQVSHRSEEALKIRGAVEHVDRQILELASDHPEWHRDGRPPPAA